MEKPKLLIIAGPNGSGKTSVTTKILKHQWIEGCEYINPDDIARDVFGNWNSQEAMMNAARHSTALREKCLAEGRSLIFETVLSAPDKLSFIAQAKRQGYFVRLFFIGTDSPLINTTRIVYRVINGGHDVPIQKVVSRYYKSIGNCCAVATAVDRLYVYDNSVENVFPELLFRANDGKLVKQYAPVRAWATPIFQAVSGSK